MNLVGICCPPFFRSISILLWVFSAFRALSLPEFLGIAVVQLY
jgi:hypothetical protein